MSETFDKFKILFLVDVNQGKCDHDVKVLANRISLSAFRILTAVSEKVLNKKVSKRGNKIPHLQWSYKIYNSSHYKLMRQVNPFKEFKNRYFEEFENTVERNIETAIEEYSQHVESKGNSSGKQYPAQVLNKVLNEIALDYQWEDPDIFSPVKSRRKNNKNEQTRKTENIVFLFINSPKNPSELRQFSGKVVLDDEIFLDSFMPPDLINKLLHNIKLYWIDTDISCLDVVPESIQLVETAIHKLHGSLIPVDTLVQTNRQCVVNVFSPLSLKEAGPPGNKGSPPLMGLISYTSVLEYHLKQQQTTQQQTKLRAANAGPFCTKCHLMSSENSTMCSFSITPTQVATHMSRSPKKHRNNKTKETQTIHARSLLSDESCNLSLYGVLPLEDTGFLQFKCEQDYLCSSEPNSGDQRDSVPFLSLIEKLIKSSQAVVLLTKSSPAVLYILRPLTSESATLSGLCLGETLGLEKRLGEASKEFSPKKRIPTVEKKPWDQLIARAIQHNSQSTGTSTHPRNNPCFDPNVLGKTHLPGCRQGLVSLIEKLNDRISQLEFLNEDEVQSLRELQRVYRRENKPIRPRETVQSPAKECENMMMNDSKPEPPTTETLPSRGVLMVNKSRQSSVFMEDSSSQSKPQNIEKQTKKLEMKNVQTEFASEEELVQYLIKTYSDMVTNGCENFYLSAQSLVLVPLHFLKDQNVENPQERCVELLEKGVVIPVSSLREKHQKEDKKSQNQTELQLQTVLRFEILSVLQQGDQSLTEEDDKLNEIVALLRTLSFITDPKSLSDFMNSSLVENYIHTLPQTLGNVYDELMQPLPAALEAILSPDNSFDQSVFSKSQMEAELDKSEATPLSQPPSTSEVAPKSNDLSINKARTRKIMHHPSLSDIGSQRQIFVLSAKPKEPTSSRKRRKSKRDLVKQFKNKTKLERRQSVAVMETVKSPRGGKRLSSQIKSSKSGYLMSPPFKSPVRKKTLVAETPSHKQKNSAMWKRQEAERRRSQSNTSVKVVEESPLKSDRPSLLSPSQNKRALHKVRRSFYSSSAGPLVRSRSLTQANADLGDRIAGRTRDNTGTLNSILKKPQCQSALFKSPDRNSSFLLSQLMGSPTPHKRGSKTPGKGTPQKVIAESPSMNTRSRSPSVSKGFPKALFQESPSCRKSHSKIVRHSPKQKEYVGKDEEKAVSFSNTPRKSSGVLVAESPSQNTRSKSLVTPTRKSVRAILFGKSPEGKPGEESRTPSKSTPRARRLILSKTPVKGQKSAQQNTDEGDQLAEKLNDEEKDVSRAAAKSAAVVDETQDVNSKKSPEKCKTPSPKIQRKIRTPSSLNHWQRRKRGRDESLVSPKVLAKRFRASQDSQESVSSELNNCELEGDNNMIFASLSQDNGQINKKKRALDITEDSSLIFSPSKRKRTMKHSEQRVLRTSYCLHNRISSERLISMGSFASGTSEGFDTTDLQASQSSSLGFHSQTSRLSQASTSSVELSNTNDDVFLSQIQDQGTKEPGVGDSPAFGLGKNTRKQEVSATESGSSSGQKVSPTGRKYSPNVTAKSLMHLMNSPLLGLDKMEKSPHINRNVAIVKHQRPRSRRSLNLQQ